MSEIAIRRSSMSFDLKGKRALVTGASSGIGLAVCELLGAFGANVALNHLPDDPRGPEAVEMLRSQGFAVIGAPGNVAEAASAKDMVATAIAGLGGIDYLVNNAGTSGTFAPIPFNDLDAMDEEFWATILSTNLLGPFRCSHVAAGELRRSRGAIVNTASVAGLGLRGSSVAYSASKAALINLTGGLARALAPDVRVNAVAPGLVRTPWTQNWPDDRKRATEAQTLLGRMAAPEEVAEAIVFLCAGPAYINAQTLVINGGSA
ncbi:MAG: SDR family oxidoreductase [Mesorhizobium sp.]